MTCADFLAFKGRQTTVAEMAALYAHLSRCRDCQALAAARTREVEATRTLGQQFVAEVETQQLRAKVEADPEARRTAYGEEGK